MPQVHKTQAKLALHIGAVAREARTRAGFTQEEAAERVGLATEVYGRMERGNMLPSLPTLVRLCRALAIDANPLLGFSSPQPPAWLTLETPPETEPPTLRRLLRTARKLKPQQLSALSVVASALLPTSLARAPGSSKRTAS
ncbi:helix-turn-helix transcriptional regulator [Cystobacter fuscus]|jgi:transcriptional regulator with XRE-family HTH domain|uniref:helix-turn-helix domain-containing protein n=1 Tax=Cystobacter fuscus TaxID=43 RepID=UPI002B2E9263|nr:helix-turn-helix transcriptional regulator [Cystobacter fuscus]